MVLLFKLVSVRIAVFLVGFLIAGIEGSNVSEVSPDSIDRGWIGRIVLKERDRLGFIRARKVGSTHLTTVLAENGWCEVHLGANECGNCLFATNSFVDCEQHNCPNQCSHFTLPFIRARFSHQQNILLKRDPGNELGKLYTFMVLRNPVDQLLSLFFYIRWACAYIGKLDIPNDVPMEWLTNLPKDMQDAVCGGDMEYFTLHGTQNNPLSKILTGAGYFQEFSSTKSACYNAQMQFVLNIDLVLLSEEMDKGLELFAKTFISPSKGATFEQNGGILDRVTPKDSLREELRRNDTLSILIQRANTCDMEIYLLGKKRFSKQWTEAFT
eukprot:m.52452 g.52452  ORF g.52452 m.52452 type:complete len:326 (-) comp7620_c1_seq1:270-1247(-)